MASQPSPSMRSALDLIGLTQQKQLHSLRECKYCADLDLVTCHEGEINVGARLRVTLNLDLYTCLRRPSIKVSRLENAWCAAVDLHGSMWNSYGWVVSSICHVTFVSFKAKRE